MISEPESSLRKRDLQDRRLSIIDVSSADDSLLDANPLLNHHPLENQADADLLYTPNSKKFEDAATKIEEWEREPHSNETSEMEKPKKSSKCNLRKSLAWDSAFFTSAGVLDPEELSSIIEGVEKEEKQPLPGIQEDVYKSCDSLSTLESESLTLEVESLDGDLFEDVRASIQKSSNKKSHFAIGNSKSGVPGFQIDDSSKMVGMASRNKMKAPPASKNPSSGMQGVGKMIKKNPIFPQTPQPVATRRESSILKQSKLPGKPSPSSTLSSKRVSLGNPHVKSEARRIVGDRVSTVPKASVIGGSRAAVPKSTLSSKSHSGPSVSTKTKLATSKTAGTLKPPSSRSAVRTPSKVASSNNSEPWSSGFSGMMSVTKLSSSVSPASSISDWSSESSSSASLAKHFCNSSRTSLESSSSRKILSDTDTEQLTNSQNPQSDSSLEGLEIQHVGFINSSAKTAPGRTVLPPAPAKPSGLRLPSPKIGFFDGVKSSRTPRGGMQPHSVVPRGLPKHGARSPSAGEKKPKLGMLQVARSITSVENTKPINQQNPLPVPLHESIDVATKTSTTLQNVKSFSDIPKEVQKEIHLKTGSGTDENFKNTLPSHVVDKAPRPCQLELVNDLHPLEGIDHKENFHYDDQVDYLSKQVGLMDINLETRDNKLNGDSFSLSLNEVSFQDKSAGLELSGQKELIDCHKKEELLKGSHTPILSISPTSFDIAASTRRPFAVKDSFCNMDDSVFVDSAVSEVKTTNLSVPESILKENS